jgi:polyisoprenoid-binding protein YceI
MKNLFVVLSLMIACSANAQLYRVKKDASSISFHSKTSMEDIEAVNKNPNGAIKVETGDVQFVVTMTSFKFKAALMEEHFNENYMESAKYPQGTFKGKLNEKLDLSKDGENKVTVTGKMTMHGVTKDATMEGTITKKGTELIVKSAFKIKLVDYDIKVPTVVTAKIAEIIDVNVDCVMEPFEKK